MQLNWISKKWTLPIVCATLTATCWLNIAAVARAADATFVGVLATAVDDSVAEKLQLSPAEKQALLKLIDEREAAAVELSATLRSLSPAEQEAKLAPFRKESEKLGLQLLKPEQRQRLESIRLERQGLAALAEPAIAEKLDLSDEQADEIAALLAAHTSEIAKSPAFKHQALRNEFERKLLAVLDESQRADWEDLISGSAAAAPAAGKPADGSKKVPAEQIAADETKPATPSAAKTAEKPLAESSKPSAPKPNGGPAKPGKIDVKSTVTADGKLRFNFRFQPWRDVLDWFAEAADFSLVSDTIPPGTFNYQDKREYTPAEAIDLLNSVLLTKGYTLVRRERLLMVVNLQDGVPPNLVATVAPEDLEKRGQFELVNTVFHVEKLTPEEAEAEIKKLLGPQGSIVVLPKAHQLSVTETAGRLLTIRRVIEAVENPEGNFGDKLSTFTFQHMTATDALAVVKQMFNIPTDKSATSDGSLRLATDPAGSKLLVSGKPNQVAQAASIIKTLDVPGGGDAGSAVLDGAPQLEIYSITSADPAAALQVMQTLLVGLPDVRLATDPKTGNLVALARPSQHATIRATLDQMQRDARQVEVIRLHSVDPQLAVLSINKLFAPEGEGALSGPKVEADATLRQLLIRGTTSQIEQIRSLLEKMGETDTKAVAGAPAKGNVRMIPLGGRSATNALSQIEKLWPALHRNKIRIVTPSAVIPTLRLNEVAPPQSPDAESRAPAVDNSIRPLRQPPQLRQPRPQVDTPATDRQRKPRPAREEALPGDPQTSTDSSVQVRLVARRTTAATAAVQRQAEGEAETDADVEAGSIATDSAPRKSKPGSEIIVAPGKGGILIASEDTQALDEFESLLNTIGSRSFSGTREFTVFYLKYAKAAAVSELLEQIFGGGGGSSGGGGGGGSLLGDLVGGGLMGSLLGGGGGGESSSPGFVTGTVAIVPDTRLNALVVQANPTDLGTVEDLLHILDQKQSPEEVLVSARPRMIPVYNTTAESVATAVRQVYQDRLVAAAGQNRQPNPEEFMRALRGGRGGGGDSRRKENEAEKLAVAVDERTNSLIISASDALFSEVKELVGQLDLATSASQVVTRVVTLKKANPQSVQEAVTAVLGESAQSSTKPKTAKSSSSGQSSGDGDRRDRGGDDGNRQRMDMFNMMREGGFGGGGGPGGGRGPGGGGPFGGGQGGPGGGRGFGGRGGGGGGGGDRGR